MIFQREMDITYVSKKEDVRGVMWRQKLRYKSKDQAQILQEDFERILEVWWDHVELW